MTKEEFIAEINLQKERGNKLLKLVQQMRVAKNNYGDGMAVFGTPRLYYTPKEELEPVKAEYAAWKNYVHDFLLSVLDRDDDFVSEWDVCLQKPYRHDVSEKNWYSSEIKEALAKLDSFVQRAGFRFNNSIMKQGSSSSSSQSFDAEKVFIVHGHNEEMKQSVARIITKLGLTPIILHEQPNGGKTIIEKFERNAENINFAVILLSADDLASSVRDLEGIKDEEVRQHLEKRARQNVVFEMGYFAGRLGRSNVFFLLQEGVAKPGDLDGIVYTSYDATQAWRFELVKELKNTGYNVSADNLLG